MCIVIRARAPLLLLRRRATPPNPRIAGHPQDEKPQSHLKHEMHAHDVIAEAQRRPGTRTEGRRGRERAEARSCIWPDLPEFAVHSAEPAGRFDKVDRQHEKICFRVRFSCGAMDIRGPWASSYAASVLSVLVFVVFNRCAHVLPHALRGRGSLTTTCTTPGGDRRGTLIYGHRPACRQSR